MPTNNLSLLSSTSRVETPFIKVTIGNYTFGVYNKVSTLESDGYGSYVLNKVQYPNYIQRLNITKINGTVNKYELQLIYAITERDDPNFFEQVFSSVSKTRKIKFSYGDASLPSFYYKEEEAIIIKVKHKVNVSSCSIAYTVTAISSASKVSLGAHTFKAQYAKPSDVIYDLLYSRKDLGLLDVFYGMNDRSLVQQEGLIFGEDIKVELEKKTNISTLDYLSYLVSKMTTSSSSEFIKDNVFSLQIVDDTSGKFNGPYFKINKVNKVKSMSTAYEIDIGFPSPNDVLSYEGEDDETYSIYYNFANELQDTQYVQRINNNGEIEEVLAPIIVSGTSSRTAKEADYNWWTNVTSFPIKCRIDIKGLLRPAVLMSHVRLNVYFYGKKFLTSGLYIVTKQVDDISGSGFKTSLSLTRIDGDNDDYYIKSV